mgnify:CR=1 FL=1
MAVMSGNYHVQWVNLQCVTTTSRNDQRLLIICDAEMESIPLNLIVRLHHSSLGIAVI